MLTLLFACENSTVVVDNGSEEANDGADTAADLTDTAPDTADTEDEPQEPVTDFSTYTGYRHFYAEVWGYTCESTVDEVGTELTSGDAYEALAAECPSCTNFYENVPRTDSICDDVYPLPIGTSYRAVLFTESGGVMTLYSYSADSGDVEIIGADNGLAFDGEAAQFDYTFNYYVDFTVDGEMFFEMTTPE